MPDLGKQPVTSCVDSEDARRHEAAEAERKMTNIDHQGVTSTKSHTFTLPKSCTLPRGDGAFQAYMGNDTSSHGESKTQKPSAAKPDRTLSEAGLTGDDLQSNQLQSETHFDAHPSQKPDCASDRERSARTWSYSDDVLPASVDAATVPTPSPQETRPQVDLSKTLLPSEEPSKMQPSENADPNSKSKDIRTNGNQTALASSGKTQPFNGVFPVAAAAQDGIGLSRNEAGTDQGVMTNERVVPTPTPAGPATQQATPLNIKGVTAPSGQTLLAMQKASPDNSNSALGTSVSAMAKPSAMIAPTLTSDSTAEVTGHMATASTLGDPLNPRYQLAQMPSSALAQSEQCASIPASGAMSPAPHSHVGTTDYPPRERQIAASVDAIPVAKTALSTHLFSASTTASQMTPSVLKGLVISQEQQSQSMEMPLNLGNEPPKLDPLVALQTISTGTKSGFELNTQPITASNLASEAHILPLALTYRPVGSLAQSESFSHGSGDQILDTYDLSNVTAASANKYTVQMADQALLAIPNKSEQSSPQDQASFLPIERASFAASPLFPTGPTSHSGSNATGTTSIHTPMPVTALAEQIKEHSKPGQPTSLELSLSPEELGKVRLLMTPEGDKVRIVIQAERPETLELLRRNTESLASELRQYGYASTSFNFGDWSNARPNTKQKSESKSTDLAQVEKVAPTLYASPTMGSSLDLRV